MPRQNKIRQRGKKHKKSDADATLGNGGHSQHASDSLASAPLRHADVHESQPDGSEQLPAWMGNGDAGPSEVDPRAPFGYVEADLKAYLRSAISSLNALHASNSVAEHHSGYDQYAETEDTSSQEERIQLRDAALKEINGIELAVATDPDTSRVLELLIDTMSEKQVRIFADRLAGNLGVLAGHRFGSHVLQSTFRALQSACTSKASLGRTGKSKPATSANNSQGVLRSAGTLVAEMTAELLPALASLIHDQFGTHIVRSLLLVLCGRPLDDSLRSKRSAAYRSKGDVADLRSASDSKPSASPVFKEELEDVKRALLQGLGANEVRALSISPTASPTLQLLLDLHEDVDQPDGPVDRMFDGLLSMAATSSIPSERSAHVEALLRDVVGSHLLQHVLGLLGPAAVRLFWKTYVEGRIGKLGVHPLANFVVASAIKRLPLDSAEDHSEFEKISDEIAAAGPKLVGEAKLGILTSFIERVAELPPPDSSAYAQTPGFTALQNNAVSSVASSFGIDADKKEHRAWLVPAVLAIKPRKSVIKDRERIRKRQMKDQTTAKAPEQAVGTGETAAESEAEGSAKVSMEEQQSEKGVGKLAWQRDEELQESDIKIQGSVLLQAIASLRSPAKSILYESLVALPSSLPLAKSTTASFLLTAVLTSESASFKQRKDLIAWMQPDLHLLADAAPRVAYTLWDKSDGFTKERHARFLLSREKFLLASPRGRVFLKRSVNLGLFRRSVGEWKKWLAEQAQQSAASAQADADEAQAGATAKKRKGTDTIAEEEDGAIQTSTLPSETTKSGKAGKRSKKVKRDTELELDAILAGVR
ncbi:Predicted RNA-binding protein, contains Pumilio domains [Ceraceosorus bombacis]|uniref:Nucleolar protein 9 n=1 Tax=Ceraceosorus bombacis TaxID=401625 RepID=A0A0P1B8B6_9BASI|nr:Predicted RNA-binding protein, contains Pumilio domains [Ceraceosorus bombacis]